MAKVNDILQNVRIMAGTPYPLAFPAADAAGGLTSDGSGALSFASASSSKIKLVHEGSGVNSTNSDNNFANYNLGSDVDGYDGALNMNIYFLILWQLYPTNQNTNDPRLYLTNTSTQCGVLTENNITPGTYGGLAFMGPMPRKSAISWTSWSVGSVRVGGTFETLTSWTDATVKNVAIRGYPLAGSPNGNCAWSWSIYKVSPLVLL